MSNKLKELYCKEKKKRELREEQEKREMLWSSCFESFPPSFYCKHTREEVVERKKEEIVNLRKILEDFNQKNCMSN